MPNVGRRKNNIKLPRSRHASEEFGGGKKGLILCPDCHASYFKKSWHHGLSDLKISGDRDMPVEFRRCPACVMIASGQYEGRITIKKIPAASAKMLEATIRAFSRRAYEMDPLDRLIGLSKRGSTWVATTTENQLANKLANKIKKSFSKAKSKTKFGPKPSDVVEITIELVP
ncbi:MAG: hypothetical protein Q8O87_04465 [bacterium]|nr:hypothetical protein [bacterium]